MDAEILSPFYYESVSLVTDRPRFARLSVAFAALLEISEKY